MFLQPLDLSRAIDPPQQRDVFASPEEANPRALLQVWEQYYQGQQDSGYFVVSQSPQPTPRPQKEQMVSFETESRVSTSFLAAVADRMDDEQ